MSNGRTNSPRWPQWTRSLDRLWLTFMAWFAAGVLISAFGGYLFGNSSLDDLLPKITWVLKKTLLAQFPSTAPLTPEAPLPLVPPPPFHYVGLGSLAGALMGIGWWVWQGSSRGRFWLASLLWLSAGMGTGGIAGVIIGSGGALSFGYEDRWITNTNTLMLYCRMYGYYFLGAAVGYVTVRILNTVSRMWQDEPPSHGTGQTGENPGAGLHAPTAEPDQRRFAVAGRVPTQQEAHATRARWPRVVTALTILAGFLGGAIYELYAIRAAIDELKAEIIPIRQAVQGYGGTPSKPQADPKARALLSQLPPLPPDLQQKVDRYFQDWIGRPDWRSHEPGQKFLELIEAPYERWRFILPKGWSQVGRHALVRYALAARAGLVRISGTPDVGLDSIKSDIEELKSKVDDL